MTRIPESPRPRPARPGSSMVVVTEYEFDAAAWRAAAGHGPDVLAVEVGTGGCDWSSSRSPRAARAARQRPDRHHPRHLRGRRRPVQPRRRRVRVQLGGVIASELGSPARSRATCSTRFVMLDQRLAALDPRQHRRLDALDLARPLQARLELRARRDHEAVVVAHTRSPADPHAAEHDRPAHARRDVAAARHRDRPARPQRQRGRQPGAVADVAVDDDPAEPAADASVASSSPRAASGAPPACTTSTSPGEASPIAHRTERNSPAATTV